MRYLTPGMLVFALCAVLGSCVELPDGPPAMRRSDLFTRADLSGWYQMKGGSLYLAYQSGGVYRYAAHGPDGKIS